MKRLFTTLLIAVLCVSAAFAQTDRRNVRKGNREFSRDKYQAAEIDYKKGLLVDSLSNAASYNLGNTYVKMENFTEADKAYQAVADSLGKDSRHGAALYHNMGNSLLAQKNYQGAIEAYKNALRRNPSDMETKSNLAYAKKMLENQQNQDQNQDRNQDQNQDQQNQQNQQNQQDQQNRDQNKDDQNKDQNKDNQDQNQNPDQNNQDQQPPKPQDGDGQLPPPKISQQDAQQMLQAIQDQEKDTQEKVKKEKALLLKSKQKEKNW